MMTMMPKTKRAKQRRFSFAVKIAIEGGSPFPPFFVFLLPHIEPNILVSAAGFLILDPSEVYMWNDFKAFLARGNVLDLAIGVIIGAAFGKIVTTFTEGIIMPFVGLVTGGMDFKTKFYDLSGKLGSGATPEQIDAAVKGGAPLLRYGQLISDIITFFIVGFVMFIVAKMAMNYFAKLAAATPPPPQEALLTEIRDILKAK
jgi:large conductance mechanosensitive channel